MNPYLPESLVMVPETISLGMLAILSLYGLKEFRQGHIGRIGIAANVFLLWQLVYPNWTQVPEIGQLYLNLGTLMAVVAVPSYVTKISLPTAFYNVAFKLYSSISVILAVGVYFIW